MRCRLLHRRRRCPPEHAASGFLLKNVEHKSHEFKPPLIAIVALAGTIVGLDLLPVFIELVRFRLISSAATFSATFTGTCSKCVLCLAMTLLRSHRRKLNRSEVIRVESFWNLLKFLPSACRHDSAVNELTASRAVG
jgi:xanthosine utilization system XapX-like protein